MFLGPVDLSNPPCFAVSVTDRTTVEEIEAAKVLGLDIVELRIDQYVRPTMETVKAQLPNFAGLGVLLTIRGQAEGGDWKGNESERLDLYRELLSLPAIHACDIELNAVDIRDQVIAAAKTSGKLVVLSFHDFDKTPERGEFDAIFNQASDLNIDILKLATEVDSPNDLALLEDVLVQDNYDGAKIVIGMGSRGQMSRIKFPALGSVLTFGFISESTAPGQLELSDLITQTKNNHFED